MPAAAAFSRWSSPAIGCAAILSPACCLSLSVIDGKLCFPPAAAVSGLPACFLVVCNKLIIQICVTCSSPTCPSVACSLQQLSELFRDLSTVSDGAADWMLGVGLKWATTCYIDMQIDGASFEQAGTWLLKAGIWATPQLAQQGMQQVLQQLTAGMQRCTSHPSGVCCWKMHPQDISPCNQQQLCRERFAWCVFTVK